MIILGVIAIIWGGMGSIEVYQYKQQMGQVGQMVGGPGQQMANQASQNVSYTGPVLILIVGAALSGLGTYILSSQSSNSEENSS